MRQSIRINQFKYRSIALPTLYNIICDGCRYSRDKRIPGIFNFSLNLIKRFRLIVYFDNGICVQAIHGAVSAPSYELAPIRRDCAQRLFNRNDIAKTSHTKNFINFIGSVDDLHVILGFF